MVSNPPLKASCPHRLSHRSSWYGSSKTLHDHDNEHRARMKFRQHFNWISSPALG